MKGNKKGSEKEKRVGGRGKGSNKNIGTVLF
jgi:hypothetical protein